MKTVSFVPFSNHLNREKVQLKKSRLTLLQCDFFSPSPPSRSPLSPLVPWMLSKTQCSLCKITRLIKANKQTTALTQLQMKANLYTINKRRSSFNLPVRPAHCSPPPFLSSSSTHPPTPPTLPCAPYLSPCCVAGLGSKARKTD